MQRAICLVGIGRLTEGVAAAHNLAKDANTTAAGPLHVRQTILVVNQKSTASRRASQGQTTF